MHINHPYLTGAGIGLRRALIKELILGIPAEIDFLELAPENWIGLGGKLGRQLKEISEERPLVAHGLSLSIGGPAALDEDLVLAIKKFIETYNIDIYSEHLSYTNDGGQLYDLLPIPFTEEAVKYTVDRIRRVQDILERQISLENVSYYLSQKSDLSEVEFVSAVVDGADCGILLDINNVYVNSVNHGYDPIKYIQQLPLGRVNYLHVAGHYVEDDGLIIDTHGSEVIKPVWDLLTQTYTMLGCVPTLLERDFNIPSLGKLQSELSMIKKLQQRAQ